MKIDLSPLNYKDKILINNEINYNDDYLKGSLIEKLSNVKYEGYITRNDYDEYFINVHVYGKMIILDSVSLEPIEYPYDFIIDEDITENAKNNQNSLDIMELLWQNIVLEVPIRYTLCDAEKLKGENWKVINDEINEGGE